jgi:hypothetical protein
MKHFFAFLLAVVLAACSADTPQSETATADSTASTPVTTAVAEDTFGDAITLDRNSSVTVSEAIQKPELHGKKVLVRGTISDVCQNKGCWLVVTDGVEEMRVTFKDYAFFVPKDSDGRNVVLEGVVSEEEISEGAATHYASVSRTTDTTAVELIKGPQKVVTMEASAVAIAQEI